jgi:hypothetical protein
MMHSIAKLKIHHTVNFTLGNAINCSTVFLKKGIIYLSQLNRHSKNVRIVQHINLSLWSQGVNVSNNPRCSQSTQHIYHNIM